MSILFECKPFCSFLHSGTFIYASWKEALLKDGRDRRQSTTWMLGRFEEGLIESNDDNKNKGRDNNAGATGIPFISFIYYFASMRPNLLPTGQRLACIQRVGGTHTRASVSRVPRTPSPAYIAPHALSLRHGQPWSRLPEGVIARGSRRRHACGRWRGSTWRGGTTIALDRA